MNKPRNSKSWPKRGELTQQRPNGLPKKAGDAKIVPPTKLAAPAVSREARKAEVKVCGINACESAARKRLGDVVRAYVTDKTLGRFGPLLRELAASKRAYHVVTSEDLEKISGTEHHEGVCLLLRGRGAEIVGETTWTRLRAQPRAIVVFLEEVRNPHNIGAFLRVAAHFGVDALVLPGSEAALPAVAYRIAEGGAEHVALLASPDAAHRNAGRYHWLRDAQRAGFQVVATSSHAPKSDLYRLNFASHVALLLGSEHEGLSEGAIQIADALVNISGTGEVESLNVATAGAVILGELWRQQRQ